MKKYNTLSIYISILGCITSILGIFTIILTREGLSVDFIIAIFASITSALLVSFAAILIRRNGEDRFGQVLKKSLKDRLDSWENIHPTPKVFLSYSYKDKELAFAVAKELKEINLEVCTGIEELALGNFQQNIYDIINEVDYIIILLSKESINSSFLFNELDAAIEKNKKIIFLIVDRVKIPDKYTFIKSADFKRGRRYGLIELFASLKEEMKKEINVVNHNYR